MTDKRLEALVASITGQTNYEIDRAYKAAYQKAKNGDTHPTREVHEALLEASRKAHEQLKEEVNKKMTTKTSDRIRPETEAEQHRLVTEAMKAGHTSHGALVRYLREQHIVLSESWLLPMEARVRKELESHAPHKAAAKKAEAPAAKASSRRTAAKSEVTPITKESQTRRRSTRKSA